MGRSFSKDPRVLRSTSRGIALVLATVAAAATATSPRDAFASGYMAARFGSDHGTPAMPNTFALYFNPAALGGTTGTTITGDVSAMLRLVRYNRTAEALSPSDPNLKNDPNYVAANTGTANLTNVLALPFAGVNTDFGTKNLRAGYAFYIPFGGMASYTRRDGIPGQPGSVDSVARWHMISGQIFAIYNTFAVAYRIEPARLTIGASVSPIIHHISTVRARNVDGSDDTVRNGQLVEGRTWLDASGVNVGIAAGVYWEALDTLHLGASYTSQPGFGETRMSGTLKTRFGANPADSEKVDFLQSYPDVVRLGGTWQIDPRWMIRADAEYTRWSVLKNQCIVKSGEKCNVASDGRDLSNGNVILNLPRNWKDTIGVRAGAAYFLGENTELFGSLGFATPAAPKETLDPSTVDTPQIFLTAGAQYRFSKHFALAGSYNHIYYFTVDTDGKNTTAIPSHPVGSPGAGDYNVSRSPSAEGQYKAQLGFVNLNASYTF